MTEHDPRPIGPPRPLLNKTRAGEAIKFIPDEAKLDLTKDQLQALKAACDGKNVIITGPGGTGKTTTIMRYLQLRKSYFPAWEIYSISPDGNSPFKFQSAIYLDGDEKDTRNKIEMAKTAGNATCLIVDEYVSLTDSVLKTLHLFDQIIIAGDQAQDGYGRQALITEMISSTIKAKTIITDILWRSDNNYQFNLLNAMVYNGQYESFSNATDNAVDPIRELAVSPGAITSALHLASRSSRHASANKTQQVSIQINNLLECELFLFSKTHHQYDTEPFYRQRAIHQRFLQGTEAEIIVASGSTITTAITDKRIEQFSIIFLGRAKYRTETLAPTDIPTTNDPFLWLKSIYHYQFDNINIAPEACEYSDLAVKLPDHLKIRANKTHFTIVDINTGRTKELYNLIDKIPRITLFRSTAAASKKWNVITIHKELIKLYATEDV
jgi:hypothetical protein